MPTICQTREEYHEKCVQKTVKRGSRGIMIWGCMTHNGLGDLTRVEGSIDQFRYLDILGENMLPSAHCLIEQNFIFQHDNAPARSVLWSNI